MIFVDAHLTLSVHLGHGDLGMLTSDCLTPYLSLASGSTTLLKAGETVGGF